METELYRHYAADGRLLYVGISLGAVARQVGHRAKSPWFHQIAIIKIERFSSRESAEAAEVRAIRAEGPLYNLCATRKTGRPRKGAESQTNVHRKPWIGAGISERTWYRRQAKNTAMQPAPPS